MGPIELSARLAAWSSFSEALVWEGVKSCTDELFFGQTSLSSEFEVA
jgi:hypothetical protein